MGWAVTHRRHLLNLIKSTYGCVLVYINYISMQPTPDQPRTTAQSASVSRCCPTSGVFGPSPRPVRAQPLFPASSINLPLRRQPHTFPSSLHGSPTQITSRLGPPSQPPPRSPRKPPPTSRSPPHCTAHARAPSGLTCFGAHRALAGDRCLITEMLILENK